MSAFLLEKCKKLINNSLFTKYLISKSKFINLSIEEPFIHIDNTNLYIDIDLQIWKKVENGYFDIINRSTNKILNLNTILSILQELHISSLNYISNIVSEDLNKYIELFSNIEYTIGYYSLEENCNAEVEVFSTYNPKYKFSLPIPNNKGISCIYICELKENDIFIMNNKKYIVKYISYKERA